MTSQQVMEYMMCIIYCICPYCRSSQQLRHLMQSQVSVEDSFQVLLLGRHRSRLSVLPHEFLAVFQRSRAVGQFLTETELERAVSLLQSHKKKKGNVALNRKRQRKTSRGNVNFKSQTLNLASVSSRSSKYKCIVELLSDSWRRFHPR